MSTEAQWWHAYVEETIARGDDTPEEIITTLEDWFDHQPAMKRFLDGRAVEPRAFLIEIRQCLAGLNEENEEYARLKALHRWAIRQATLATAAAALHAATVAFQRASREGGMAPYYASRVFEEATSRTCG